MKRLVRISRLLGGLALLTSSLLSGPAQAAPGDLDPGFAGTGTARLGFGCSDDVARGLAVQSDGKHVVVGSSRVIVNGFPTDAVTLLRYHTDETLDASFGAGGTVVTEIASGDAAAHAVAIQADGKIVVAGYAHVGGDDDFLVARYLADGALDPSFDGDGIATTELGATDRANAMLLQSDGKILVVGVTGGGGSVGLVRYLSNGSLDTSFDGDGKVTASGGAGSGIALQPDGKILVAASTGGFRVFRFLTSGAPDATFDGDGNAVISMGSGSCYAVAYQLGDGTHANPDRIVAAGSGTGPSGSSFALVRLTLAGALDASFDGDGIAFTNLTSGTDIARAVRVLRNINGPFAIVAGGAAGLSASASDFGVVRYHMNGTLDTAFDGDGIAITSFGADMDEPHGMTLVGATLVMVGATERNPNNRDFALVGRNVTSGALEPSYDGDGLMTIDVRDRNAAARAVAHQADGRIVVAGSRHNGAENDLVLARFHEDGTLDASFGVAGKVIWTTSPDDEARAVAIQPDGRIVVAGWSSAGILVLRFDADGDLDATFDPDPVPAVDLVGDVAIQPDGRIVVAGATSGASTDIAVIRYLANGTLDASFDGDGLATTAVSTGNEAAYAVEIQPDGKIVVAGYAEVGGTQDFALVRYQANGALDHSFGSFGRVATHFGATDVGVAMALQPDGRIVVAGYTANASFDAVDFAVARYGATGALDVGFDGDGKVTTAIGFGVEYAMGVGIQPDGKIVAAGPTVIGAGADFGLVRYAADGALDAGYGSGGKTLVDFGAGGHDIAAAMSLDDLGRAVVVGQANTRFAIARVLGDPEPVSVPESDVLAGRHRIVSVTPNPGAGRQSFAVELARAETGLSLNVFSVAGQRVFRRELPDLAAGVHRVEWDGRVFRGALAPPGVYLARLEGGAATRRLDAGTMRVVRIR